MWEPRFLMSQKYGPQGEMLGNELLTLSEKGAIELIGEVEVGTLDDVVKALILAANREENIFIAFGNATLPAYVNEISKLEYLTSGLLQNRMLVAEVRADGTICIPAIGYFIKATQYHVFDAVNMLLDRLSFWQDQIALSAAGGGTVLTTESRKNMAIIKFWPLSVD